jgi:hypothetical protein
LAKRKSRAKQLIPPVIGIILAAFLIVGSLQVATNSGWSFAGISFPPWLTGLGGGGGSGGIETVTVTGTNGLVTTTTVGGNPPPTSIIPTGQLSFKMVAVAQNTDGSNTTVFEKSTLPAFAVIRVQGKQVNGIQASGVVAVLTDNPMPSNAQAQFKLNFSVWIPELAKGKWTYKVVTTPLIRNNTLAMVTLNPMSVVSSDVFPTTGSVNETRDVVFTITGQVNILSSQQLTLLSLTGSTYSSAEFAADGTVTVCTDCGSTTPGGPTLGGITLTPTSTVTTGSVRLDDPCGGLKPATWCNPTPPTTTTKPVGGLYSYPTVTTAITYLWSYTQSYTQTSASTNCLNAGYQVMGMCETATQTATPNVPVQVTITQNTNIAAVAAPAAIPYSQIVTVNPASSSSSTGAACNTSKSACGSYTVVTRDTTGKIVAVQDIPQKIDLQQTQDYGPSARNAQDLNGLRPGKNGFIMGWLGEYQLFDVTYLVNWYAILIAVIVGLVIVGICAVGYIMGVKITRNRRRR